MFFIALIHVLGVGFLLLTNGKQITIEGYFGAVRMRVYYVTEEYEMTEAAVTDVCQNRGLKLLQSFKTLYQSLFVKQSQSEHHHIWLPFIKLTKNDKKWTNAYTCLKQSHRSITETANDAFPTCSIINMTSDVNGHTLYSSPCNKKYSLLCFQDIEKGASSIMRFNNMYIYNGTNIKTTRALLINVPIGECESYLSLRHVVAAYYVTFNDGGTTCKIIDIDVYTEPAYIVLDNFNDLSATVTILYKNLTQDERTNVVVDKREQFGSDNSQFPCITHSSQENEKPTPSSANFSFQTDGSCICICNQSYPKIYDELSSISNEIHRHLIMDRKKLSSYKRLKQSATDQRVSSTAMGAMAVTVLMSVMIIIVMIDVSNISTKRQNVKMKYKIK